MAFDESVAARVRTTLTRLPGVTEKKMFGGLAFLVNGNMCCGVLGATPNSPNTVSDVSVPT
jgi:hypothetical protein